MVQEVHEARAATLAEVAQILELDVETAEQVVASFEEFVANRFVEKVESVTPADVAQRNPYAYAARGITAIDEWTNRASDDIAASSLEGLMGKWLEEVAIIVSGGIKPGGGVDLQIERIEDGIRVIELYAIQSTINTKNSGGSKKDEDALNASARELRGARRHVDLFIGYVHGRRRTTELRGVTRMASPEFWEKLSGQAGFQRRLYLATVAMSALLAGRVPDDRGALIQGVGQRYGDGEGLIDRARVPL